MDKKTLDNIKGFANERYSQRKGQHSIYHIERVANNALIIANILSKRYSIDKNLLEAICYLHDIVMINKRFNIFISFYNHIFEKSLNRRHLHDLLKGINLPEKECLILTNAIVNHPYSIPYHRLNKNNDIYSKILQDADSLDYISNQRLISFNKKFKVLSSFTRFYILLIRREIKYFLNFPELGQNLTLFEG